MMRWATRMGRIGGVHYLDIQQLADETGGEARWTARYTFSRTGRPVVNRVRGLFAFRDGLIVRHYDHFPFWRWARQALGPVGVLLGWSAPLKWMIRRRAARALERFRLARASDEPA